MRRVGERDAPSYTVPFMRDYKPQSQKNAVERALQSFAQTPFGNKLFLHVFPTVDRASCP